MNVLLIVSSPLQLICAKQTARQLGYEPDFILLPTLCGEIRSRQIQEYVKRQGVKYKVLDLTDFDWLKHIITTLFSIFFSSEKYDIVINGESFCSVNLLLALQFTRAGGELIGTDDGTATLNLQELERPTLINRILKFALNVKRVRRNRFFSLFDIDSDMYEMNRISLCPPKKRCKKNGVYLLGTASQVYADSHNMTISQFLDYFKQTIKIIKEQYPNQTYYYSPHGRDKVEEVNSICQKEGFSIIPSEISVEVDYTEKNYNPLCIYGYYSSASYSLKMIFPESRIINIKNSKFPSKFKDLAEKSKKLADRMGIEEIDVTFE